MNNFDFASDPRDCGADAAGYVLGALDHQEAEGFRRHLSACAVCRDEVATLHAIASALPMAAVQLRAPGRLKRDTLSRARAEAKATGAPTRPRWLRGRISTLAFTPSISVAKRGALATGGLLAAAAIGAGALEVAAGNTSRIRIVPAAVINQGPSASAVLDLSPGHAELIVAHLPAPPAGKIYQVWLDRRGRAPEPTSALFSVTSSGTGTVDVPGNLTSSSEVTVTPEPLGGSAAPTHAPVIVAALPS